MYLSTLLSRLGLVVPLVIRPTGFFIAIASRLTR